MAAKSHELATKKKYDNFIFDTKQNVVESNINRITVTKTKGISKNFLPKRIDTQVT